MRWMLHHCGEVASQLVVPQHQMCRVGLGGRCCVGLWLDSEMESCLLAMLAVPVGCPQAVQCGAVVVGVSRHLSG